MPSFANVTDSAAGIKCCSAGAVPATSVRLRLLPFIQFAERFGRISNRWFLKSIDAGFEIWQHGQGLTVHSYSVKISLKAISPHKKSRQSSAKKSHTTIRK
jgi:hypothetical protein